MVRRLAGLVDQRVRGGGETRGLNDPSVPLTAASLVDWLGGQPNDAGIRVTEKTAWTMTAIYRAVSLISSTCAGVPLNTVKESDGLTPVAVPVLNQPCIGLTRFEFWEMVYAWLLTWGNFYAFRKMDPTTGRVTALNPIPPSQVKVGQSDKAISDTNPFGKVFAVSGINGNSGEVGFGVEEIFHIPALGYDGITGVSPIRLMATGIGTAIAAEKYSARQFAQGQLMGGILQSDQRITNEQADALVERWRAKVGGLARAHDIVALGNGAKFQPITMPNTDAQMIETRRFEVEEVARQFGLPPWLLSAVDKTTAWGAGVEQMKIAMVDFTLDGWLKRVSGRVSLDVCPIDVVANHDVRLLTRGDTAVRMGYYTGMRNIGAMNADEIRALEGMGPLPDGQGQTYLNPLNMAPAAPAPGTPTPPAAPADDGSSDDAGN